MSGSRVVVGYEGGSTGLDALAFANRWSLASGDALTVVTVHPGAAALGAGRVDAEWVAYAREEADRLLAEAKTLVDPAIEATFARIDSGSAAHGLSDMVEVDGERALLVLGSQRSRGLRRTFPGSTAERLLQGSPVPVVMVPWGYDDIDPGPLTAIAVAYVDTPDGRAAFNYAAQIAQKLSAHLTVVSVVPDTRVVPGLGEPRLFGPSQRQGYLDSLDAIIATAPEGLAVRGELRNGPVVDALTELSLDDFDILVCGSRGYGPIRRVFLGGVSSRIVRHSKIPVLLVPRG
ncbi:MAG: hypothetical protein JWP10_83 [Nocardioidaceae bacterium]|nr:hypothetical protein [Nocardioidaceae bacterium]